MLRQAHVDPVISKALIGHVTDEMREHYSAVRLDEKRAAVASVLRSFPAAAKVRTTVRTPARRRTTPRRRGLRSRELIRVPPSGRWNHERKLIALRGSRTPRDGAPAARPPAPRRD
jgi:hypothetical protein